MCNEKLIDNRLIYHTDPQVSAVADELTQCTVLLQTKVDAQCDKLATKFLNYVDNACDDRCFRVIASYLSKVTNFNLPHLYLTHLLGATPVEFCRDLWHQKTRVSGLSCGIVYEILHLAISVEHRLVTDRHTTTAYTVLLWCCMVKKTAKRRKKN